MLRLREPLNALTHGVGILLSAAGLIYLLLKAIQNQSGLQLAGALAFGISLIALYTASTLYHGLPVSPKAVQIMRRVDHTMIYVLIAGTYTPICLVTLKGVLGWTLFGVVWALALLGIVVKLLWMNAPRWLSTSFYVILGWLAAFFIVPLFKALPLSGFLWLLAGGMLYTIGAVFYAAKPRWLKVWKFGYHEVFHLFILAGSASHFLLVSRYVFV